ncbi:MAG TPA: alpha/beta fold hydrolase, partial [Gemmatimonadaceae bacterium]
IITVDAQDRIAQAVAIRGDKIVAVGTNADIAKLAGPQTQRIDLHGRAMTPGLIDAHDHFSSGGAERLYSLDLSYPIVKSITDVQAAIAAQVKKLPPGSWIEGRGWDEGKFTEHRLLSAKDLDAVAPNNPVSLTQTTGHYIVANSAALKLANVTKETRDPPNGTIDRYPDGTPTGVLKESAAGMVRRLVPRRTQAQTEEGMRDLAKAFNAEGMTGLKDPGISADVWSSYKRVLADSALSVRVFVLWRSPTNTAASQRLIDERAATTRPYETTGDDRLISGGIKIYVDGSGGARTAWLYEDWNKNYNDLDAGNKGYPASNPDTIRKLIRMYHDAGMHVGVHSIGDRSIDWVVDTYAQAEKENPKPHLRHAIIHSNIPSDHAIEAMAMLQKTYDAGYPEPSATFHWWLGDTYAANFGPVRAKRLNPFHTYLKKGIIWANGSDYSVTPFAARYAIWAAVARQTLLNQFGDAFGRDEAVDVHTAVKAVTIWAAHQMFLEKKTGSIEPGKYADLAVWDRDFYTVPTDQLKDAKCEMTIFNGKVVYRADEATTSHGAHVSTSAAQPRTEHTGSADGTLADELPPAEKTGYVSMSDGARLFYKMIGTGPDTIIAIHGGPGMDLESIYGDFKVLGEKHTVIFYDQRGGGKSTLPADTTQLFWRRQVQDLDELRQHFGLKKFVLMAHSYGPLLAASYAIAHPDAVSKMVFFGPVPPRRGDFWQRYGKGVNARLDSTQRRKQAEAARRMTDPNADQRQGCRDYWAIGMIPRLAEPERTLPLIKSDLCATDLEGIRYGNRIGNHVIMNSYGDWDLRPQLKSLAIPTLVVHGEQETIPMDLVEEWVTSLPNAHLMKVPRAAHFTYAERPELVWPAVERFLSGGGWGQ